MARVLAALLEVAIRSAVEFRTGWPTGRARGQQDRGPGYRVGQVADQLGSSLFLWL